MRVAMWAVALAGLVACTATNPKADVRDGDPSLFATEVQPIVRTQCAFIGCHGREGMPLTLYAVDYLRLRDPEGVVDPSRPVLDERALSPAELDHNRRSFAARVGVDDPDADRDRFIRRLIPRAEGGIAHADVEVYSTVDDPELDAILAFLESVR